ncbi:hypothetical protein B0E33_01340 [Roseibium algicola]|uniref:Bro-N domain-containing protein n=1 Tax=Roseibium algicola TaxID=2857014 RepID=A0ABM6HWJ6_9HYPH|nr:BRO family protein [Roseibium aggregatum]AQQ02399.1 hypothetical protein B0E33_01340 [Roseibium aggregatum]
MNDLMKYLAENEHIRTAVHDGQIWAVAKDVCEATGYGNHVYIASLFNEKDKMRLKNKTGNGVHSLTHLSPHAVVLSAADGKSEKFRKFNEWFYSNGAPTEDLHKYPEGMSLLIDAFSDYERKQKTPEQDRRRRKLAGIVEPEDAHDPVRRIRNVISEAGAIHERELFKMFPELDAEERRAIVRGEVLKGTINRFKGKGPIGFKRPNDVTWLVWKGTRLKRAEKSVVVTSDIQRELVKSFLIRRSPCSERELSRGMQGLTAEERNIILSDLESENLIKRENRNEGKKGRPSIVLTWIG